MKIPRKFFHMAVSLGLVVILAGAIQAPPSAWASMEDAAVFYEELAEYGDWVEDENYGPVWYPNQVQENWRPYVDGRWAPSEQGYLFETEEPWGWATYHYGNWMPTESYGWVWVPGRTWYPSTVTWRQSPQSDAPDSSYLGWAPIPPENYTPPQGYYPPDYRAGTPYRGPAANLVTAPFWIFVRAANFLLGLGQSYQPSYSYWNSAALVPPTYVPYYYGRTVTINNYYTPNYYPRGVLAAGRGYYNWGPSIPYVARVSRIRPVVINNYVKNVNIYKFRNVAPPRQVMARRAYLRNMVPPAMAKRQRMPRGVRARNMRMARANLARPNVLKANAIKNAPTFKKLKVKIPRAQVNQMKPGRGMRGARGVPGAALPASAMMQPTKKMQKGLRKIPPNRRIKPVAPTARKWQVPQTPGAAAVKPAALQKPGTPGMAAPGMGLKKKRPGAPQALVPGQRPGKGPKGLKPGGPQVMTPGTAGAPGKTWGGRKKGQMPAGMKQGAPGTPQAGLQPAGTKPGRKKPGAQGLTPGGPQAMTPGKAGAPGKTWGGRKKGQMPAGMKRGAPGTPQAGLQPAGTKPGRKKPGAQGLTPSGVKFVKPAKPGTTASQGRLKKTSPWSKAGQSPRAGFTSKTPGQKPQQKRQARPQFQRQPQKQQKKVTSRQPQSSGARTTKFKQPQRRTQPQQQRFQRRPQVQQQKRVQPRTQQRQQVRQQPKQQRRPQVKKQGSIQPRQQMRRQPKRQVRQQPRQQVRRQPTRQVRQQPEAKSRSKPPPKKKTQPYQKKTK